MKHWEEQPIYFVYDPALLVLVNSDPSAVNEILCAGPVHAVMLGNG